MTVVDLATARAERDAERQFVLALGQGIAEYIVETAIRQAERAFAVSNPLITSDLELACGINRYVRRRLRAKVRRKMGREPQFKGLRDQAVEMASNIFTGRLLALEIEQEACGRTA